MGGASTTELVNFESRFGFHKASRERCNSFCGTYAPTMVAEKADTAVNNAIFMVRFLGEPKCWNGGGGTQ